MKNKCLITSVGRKVSLIRAFQEAGWKVYGKDDDARAIGLKVCDEVWVGQSVDLVVPTRDAELPDSHPYSTCRDKLKFYHWCKKNGFRTPEVYFVKPRVSSSGKTTEVLWQEMIEGEEYSVDLFADFDGNVISVVPRRRVKVLNGESAVTTTVTQPTLVEESIRLSKGLGLTGHNCLQAFITNGVVCWTDVNCRFGGASIVGIRAGCKSPKWLLKLVNGERVEPVIGQYKTGLTGMSYTGWEFYED